MPTETLSETPRRNLVGLGREALAAEMAEFGAEPFRARQLWHWIYRRGATDFAAMTSLSKPFRDKLAARYVLERPAISRSLASLDGTRKWLLRFADGEEVETVHIPEEDRGTLCVSSQVGCTLTCSFCHTGTQRLVRNLTADEIVGQVMIARDALGEWPSPQDDRLVTNIVLMGMGEPLYNYDNVAAAVKIVMDPEGLSISRRKITLSTSGVVPMIRRCGARARCQSRGFAARGARRHSRRLVPLNRKYPMAELLAACRSYPGSSNARRITFEYVMLKGVNDSPAEARELVRLLAGHPGQGQSDPVQPVAGRALRMLGRTRRSRRFPTSSLPPAIRRRCARRAAATSSPPAASSNRRASECAGASGRRCPPPDFLLLPYSRLPRVLYALLGSALAAYGVLLGGLYVLQRHLLYFPDVGAPRAWGSG